MRKIEIEIPFVSPAAMLDMSEKALKIAASFDGKSASHYVAWYNLAVALGDEASKVIAEESKHSG